MKNPRLTDKQVEARLLSGSMSLRGHKAFRNLKNGREYAIRGVSITPRSLELVVSYSPLNDSDIAWTRSLAEFLQKFGPLD